MPLDAARKPAGSGRSPSAAAAAPEAVPPSGSGGAAAAAAQQPQQAAQPSLDIDSLQVTAEFVYTVQDGCSLRVHDTLTGRQAQTAAVVAAALVNLRQRERALDAAIATARQQLPGVLDPAMLKKFDSLVAQGRQGPGMALLGFGQLHALCRHVAPDVCRAVEEQVVQLAAEVQASSLAPVPGGGFKQRSPSFDLPLAVVQRPEWQGCVRKMRDAVIAWQQQQQQQQPGPPKQQQGATASAVPKGTLQATFTTHCTTPDGLAMRQDLTISIAPPGGRQLLQLVREQGLGLYAMTDPALELAAVMPEPLLQQVLEVAAMGSVCLGRGLAFTCTLPAGQQQQQQQQAAGTRPAGNDSSSSSGSSGSGVSSSIPLQFGGTADDLLLLIYSLSWMEGDTQGTSTSGVWVPNNGRVRLQRCSSGSGGSRRGWPLLQSDGPPRDGAGEEAAYRVAVWPTEQAQQQQAEQQQPQQQQGGEPHIVQLTQLQLHSLLDCLDSFMLQHPGFVQLLPPGPLQAPPPTWDQRVASWMQGQGRGGDSSMASSS